MQAPGIKGWSGGRIAGVIALIASVALGACSRLPERPEVAAAGAEAVATSGPLHAFAGEALARTGGPDALLAVPSAREAMELRLAMIDTAETSLDAQYFVWNADAAGDLLLKRFMLAADRGVKVRLLVDDLYLLSSSDSKGPDLNLASVDQHPNVQVRVFNPGQYRSGTMGIAGNFMGSFDDFNRRMHNKLFIADGNLAVVGGRNMANEYYGLADAYNFLDLDALVVGAVVPTMIESFDQYWNSQAAYPAGDMVEELADDALEQVYAILEKTLLDESERLASYPRAPRDWRDWLAALPARMHGGSAVFLQDDPDVDGDESRRLIEMLEEFDRPEDREVMIVTPYLIPLEGMIDELAQAQQQGMQFSLLTASLASGDHTAVNAHYKKYREALVATGARLFESHHQPGPELRAMADVQPVRGEFVALHPKVGVTDRARCFVGSLNLDPRALVLNTENGLQVDSVGFCSEIGDLIELYIAPENAWEVTLDAQGQLQWTSSEGTVHKQPARSGGQRMSDFFFRILPIEDLL